MTGTKETSELLRAASAVLVDIMDGIEDGKRDMGENLRALGLIPTIMQGIRGISLVYSELKDLSPEERDALILEIRAILLRTKRLSHRSSDLAADILHLADHNVRAISYMLSRPPTAELV